jgi:histidine triad (HIT) family protein
VSVNKNCAFCAIVEGDRSARVVYQDPYSVAFLPLNPATRGHTLVVPRRHVADIFGLDLQLAAQFSKSVLRAAVAVRTALAPDGMNLITSSGEAAQQTVFHLHVHVLPRGSSDRVGDLWPEDQPMVASEADLIQQQILSAAAVLFR